MAGQPIQESLLLTLLWIRYSDGSFYKEVWQYLGASFPSKRKQLEKLARCKSFDDYERIIEIELFHDLTKR